ncbi:MAG: hypothetical protein ACYTAO_18135 [Planctomycetota bacterium]|jgi:hypothetical protein
MTQIKEPKPSENLVGYDIALLVLPCILTVLVPSGVLLYIFGRLSWRADLLLMFHLGAVIFIILCFFTSAARLFIGWKGHTTKKKLLRIAEVCIPMIFVALCLIGSPQLVKSRLWPDATPFTYGYRDRIRSKADIPAIRTWLKTLNKEQYKEPDDRVAPDEWPESLKVLNPPLIFAMVDRNGNPQVRIICAGVLLRWGMTIGMEDMKIPVSTLNDEYESWLLVEPGVYVYDW